MTILNVQFLPSKCLSGVNMPASMRLQAQCSAPHMPGGDPGLWCSLTSIQSAFQYKLKDGSRLFAVLNVMQCLYRIFSDAHLQLRECYHAVLLQLKSYKQK